MTLKNDCFALPPGYDWTPVETALAELRQRMACVTASETVALADTLGRILAADITATRANPPYPNAAVDGYGFAFEALPPHAALRLPLHPGRAAAGAPFRGALPPGDALRILTGAPLPAGVDTVILQEDAEIASGHVMFASGVKPGANTRQAGEDVAVGEVIFRAGRVITPADIAQAAATGLDVLPVRKRLRVGLLSTGDEISAAPGPTEIYDANRPMLTAFLSQIGCVPVDLGHVRDDAAAVRAALIQGAETCDAVVTSGGASGGDEDHVAQTLRDMDALHEWRVAVKPGRPLALAQIGGTPIFGLPGNPVAVFVCFLIFVRPALGALAGAGWREPPVLTAPAGFDHRKKPGRTEYLRGRLTSDGRIEKFRSEGSGLISGLRWSDGLVFLEHDRGPIAVGEPVRWLPYSALSSS